MKKINWLPLIAVFIAAVALWFSTVYWLPELSGLVERRVHLCTNTISSDCVASMAKLGVTGDMFGAVSSLFSALALFLVILTFWQDNRSRRDALKPLVVSTIYKDELFLDSPVMAGQKSIDASTTVTLSNQSSDAALNVVVTMELIASTRSVASITKRLPVPLVVSGPAEIDIKFKIEGDALGHTLSVLTQADGIAELHISANYDNLEKIQWSTSVIYELRCVQPMHINRLNAVRNDTGDFANLWANDIAVSLRTTVRDDSWSHKRHST